MGQLHVKDAEEAPEPYLLDEDGNKRQFEPCVIDQAAFKRRLIERKVNDATSKT